MILVFEKDGHCQHCELTKKYLDKQGATYSTHTIEDAQLEFAQKANLTAAPIVLQIKPGEEVKAHAGYRRDMLAEYLTQE